VYNYLYWDAVSIHYSLHSKAITAPTCVVNKQKMCKTNKKITLSLFVQCCTPFPSIGWLVAKVQAFHFWWTTW